MPVRSLAIGVALAMALGSCGTEPPRSALSGEAEVPPDLALYPTRPIQDALVEGRLLRAGRCLLLVARDGTTYGLAWPSERTRWDAAQSEFVLDGSGGRTGEDVWIGGGPAAVTAANVDDPRWEWVQPPRAECMGDQFWMASSLGTEER